MAGYHLLWYANGSWGGGGGGAGVSAPLKVYAIKIRNSSRHSIAMYAGASILQAHTYICTV